MEHYRWVISNHRDAEAQRENLEISVSLSRAKPPCGQDTRKGCAFVVKLLIKKVSMVN
jgi:hypothetical protein